MRDLIGFAATAALVFAAGSASALEVFTFGFIPPVSVIDYSTSGTHSAFEHSENILGLTAAAGGDAIRDGSDVVMRAKASLSGTLTSGTDPAQLPTIGAFAGLTDTVVISSAGLDGTIGYVGFGLNYDGVLSGSVIGAGGYSAVAFGVVCLNYGSCPIGQPAESQALGVLGAPATSLSVEGAVIPGLLQFTYGVPFDYSLYVVASAVVGGPPGSTFDVRSDFFNTATLGKVTVYDATGALDSDAIVTSASPDFAYSVTVPEPRAWAMMIAGFGLMGAMLRKRNRLEAAT